MSLHACAFMKLAAMGLPARTVSAVRIVWRQTSRVEPLDGSTLQRPEISRSVGSLLQILDSPESPISGPRHVVTAPPPLMFDPSAAMPPPSPASPESVATLSPPCSKFILDAPTSCPICLEAIEEATAALQMPCARSHVFHKECLITWLGERNTCPVCRHHLPETEAAEATEGADGQTLPTPSAPAVTQQLSVRLRGLEAFSPQAVSREAEMAEANSSDGAVAMDATEATEG